MGGEQSGGTAELGCPVWYVCTIPDGAVRKSCSVHKHWGDGDAWTVRLHMMGGGSRVEYEYRGLMGTLFVVAVMVRRALMLLIWKE